MRSLEMPDTREAVVSRVRVECKPVREYDREKGGYTDKQRTGSDGRPLWEVEGVTPVVLGLLGVPIKLDRTPGDPTRPAPALGEHTAEVLGEAGFSEDEVAAMIEAGAAAGPNAEAEGARFMG